MVKDNSLETENNQESKLDNKEAAPIDSIKIQFIPQPTTSATPSMAKPNSDGEIFAGVGPKNDSDSSLLTNISRQQENAKPENNIKNILGNSALLEKSLQEERELKLKKKVRLLQSVFVLIFLAVVAVQGYFYYELKPGLNLFNLANINFEQNLTHRLTDLNTNLRSVQTLINKYHYLSAQLSLNQFSFLNGKFFDATKTLTSNATPATRTKLQTEIDEVKPKLAEVFKAIKKDLELPLVVETFPTSSEEKVDAEQTEINFQNDLRKALAENKKALLRSTNPEETAGQLEELKFINNSIQLVGNKKLMTALKQLSVENFTKDLDGYQTADDPAQKKRFESYIATFLESTKIDLATIASLKNARIEWASIIDKIQNVTDTVNNEHNTGTNNNSKFVYSGYEFNADANKIVLSGANTTKSGTNTSVMSNLIDSFEASPFFQNVVNRSFPKTKSGEASGEETYTMNFKIDLGLEKDGFSSKNNPIALLEDMEKIGVKRTN